MVRVQRGVAGGGAVIIAASGLDGVTASAECRNRPCFAHCHCQETTIARKQRRQRNVADQTYQVLAKPTCFAAAGCWPDSLISSADDANQSSSTYSREQSKDTGVLRVVNMKLTCFAAAGCWPDSLITWCIEGSLRVLMVSEVSLVAALRGDRWAPVNGSSPHCSLHNKYKSVLF